MTGKRFKISSMTCVEIRTRNNILFECVSWSQAVFSLDDHGQERFETRAESDSHVVPHAMMVVIPYIA
jgi:hypothetical protein